MAGFENSDPNLLPKFFPRYLRYVSKIIDNDTIKYYDEKRIN